MTDSKCFVIKDLCDLIKQAPQLLAQLHSSIILLEGELGAGKTTLVKSLLELLGVKEMVTSPTFSIINEYQGDDIQIAHMDLYRLKKLEECLDIGIEDYLYDYDFCFIEWPEIIRDLLPSSYQQISITSDPIEQSRVIKISSITNE